MLEYVPGQCNIGPSEIRRRKVVALSGSIFSAITLVGFITTDVTRSARLSIFLPLMVASIGWAQSRRKFCLAYGFMGSFNFGKMGSLSRVSNPVERAADRSTALNILSTALGLALGGTLIVLALPL